MVTMNSAARGRLRWTARRCQRFALDLAIASLALAVFDYGLAAALCGSVAMVFGLVALHGRRRSFL